MIAFQKFALASAIALCSASLPAASMAATPGSDVSEVRVPTADLDLGTAQGVATLRHRIHVAAITVCGDVLPSGSAFSDSVRLCRIEAEKRALPAVREAESKRTVSLEAEAIPR